MSNKTQHYDDMSDKNLFIKIKKAEYKAPGLILDSHWHEQIQIFYFMYGTGIVYCNSKKIEVAANDIIIINSNELHCMENTGDGLILYVIKIDLSFIYSNKIDSIQAQFLAPLSQNLILFENLLRDDENILRCVHRIIDEYFAREIGFELAIKSQVYDLIVLLLRGYIHKIYSENEFKSQLAILGRFDNVIRYMENNFTEKLDIAGLSNIAGISEGHFSRLFKQITSISAMDYLNNLRINKAVELMQNSDLNMTEIAINCGFSDSNYFSRVFKKHKKISPIQMKKLSGRY